MTGDARTSTLQDTLGVPPLTFDPIVGLRVRGTGETLAFPKDVAPPYRLGAGSVELPMVAEFVSKVHCTLEPSGDRVRVRDGSKNGTFVDGVRQSDFHLSPGGMFQIGKVFLIAVTDRAVAAVPSLYEMMGTGEHDAVDRALRAGMSDESVAVFGEKGTGGIEIAGLLHGMSTHQRRPLVTPGGATEFDDAMRWFTGCIVADVATIRGLARLAPETAKALAKVASGTIPVVALAETAKSLVDHFGLFLDAAHTFELPAMRFRPDRTAVLEAMLKAHNPKRTLGDLGPENQARIAAHRWPHNLAEMREAARFIEAVLSHPKRSAAAASLNVHHQILQNWITKLQLELPNLT